MTTTLLQAQQLLQLIDERGTDTDAIGESFDAWCTEQIKPWVDEDVHMDEATRRRWAGEDINLSQPLPSGGSIYLWDAATGRLVATHTVRAPEGPGREPVSSRAVHRQPGRNRPIRRCPARSFPGMASAKFGALQAIPARPAGRRTGVPWSVSCVRP